MTEPNLNAILNSVIPQWDHAEFVFQEPTTRRSAAVQARLARQDQLSSPAVGNRWAVPAAAGTTTWKCVSSPHSRTVYDSVHQADIAGVVLVLDKSVRDGLLFLGRLSRLGRTPPPVLALIPPPARNLTSLLLESGATNVLSTEISDAVIADWCQRVVARRQSVRQAPGGSTLPGEPRA